MTVARPFNLTTGEHRRVTQIDQLVALRGVDELLASMSDPSWTVRRAGVAALAALGDDAVGPLCTWLRDRRTDEHAIAAAVDALSTSTGATATSAVITLLEASGIAAAVDASRILGRRRAIEAVPMLGRAIAHPDDNVATSAIEAIGAIGGSGAIEELVAVVERDRSFFRTFPALQVLAKTGDPRAIAPLASLLEDDVYGLEAARALGHTGSARAIAPLASLLPRGEAIVRLVALALADLLVRAEWVGALDHVVATLRTTLASELPRFTAALESATAAEHAALSIVIGRIGDEDALLATVGDDDPEIRIQACETLARRGDPAAVPELFALLHDTAPGVGLAASTAIRSLGSFDTGALAIAALESGSPAVRRHALQILTWVGSAEAFDALCFAVGDGDPRIAELAVVALGAIDDPRIDPVLVDLARSPDPAVRASTMRAAVHRLGDHASQLLERGLDDENGWVRYYACQGLGRIGRTQAVAQLVVRLGDVAPYVRLSAIEALSRLDAPAAWDALCLVMRSPDVEARRVALLGIGLHPNDAAIPFLLEAAIADDVATRLVALTGLARRSDAVALEVLAAAALDDREEIRDAAVSLLGERTDPLAAELIVDLALATRPEHPVHRTLSRPGAARIDAIGARLANGDDHSAPILAAALARMCDSVAIGVLFGTLEHATPPSRRAAATMLVAMEVPGSRDAVARVGRDDLDHNVRCVCTTLVAE